VYSWLRDGLIPGASGTLEALWAYAWISFFLAAGATTSAIRYPFPWVLGLILLPALFGRLVDRSAWGPRWVRQHGLTVLVVGLFVGFMIPFHAAGAAWLVAASGPIPAAVGLTMTSIVSGVSKPTSLMTALRIDSRRDAAAVAHVWIERRCSSIEMLTSFLRDCRM